jgi:pimeloyl-ACP methyl ester carboxylesterase
VTRTIAYDRRGYGDSQAPEPYTGTTVGEQADDLAALIDALDAGPALLVGHGLGALIALDVLLHRAGLARGGVLVEPPLLYLSPRGPEVVGELRDAIEAGAIEHGPGGAVDGYLQYLGGPDAIALYGDERAAAARSHTQAFAADLVAGPTWGATRRQLRSLDLPVAVLAGRRTSIVTREVAAELDRLLPQSRLIEPDTGHLVQLEATAELAAAISALAASG